MNVQSYLDQSGVAYRMSHHQTAYTAQDLAATEHMPGMKVIKPVVVRADGQFVMCALPAPCRIDLQELKRQLDAHDLELADESQLQSLFPDCEVGAEPPIGRIYGLRTLMDKSLLDDVRVTFQAGTHTDAVTMAMNDFRRVAQPEIGQFARHV